MLYASAVALLLALAALALEDVVRQRRWPVRGLWAAALFASLLLPPFAAVLPPERDAPRPTAPAGGRRITADPHMSAGWTEWAEPLARVAAAPAGAHDPGSWILALWAVSSAALALFFGCSYRALVGRRRGWARRDVDGHTIWVSPDTGPAVVGFFPGDIVLPDWLVGAAAGERHLVLAHEEEHVRARDPGLLAVALLVCIAMPWNPALWWIGRRLRRAVEIDCDLRVLGRGVDPRAYSRLLIEVADRGVAHRLAVAALAESPLFLERRIRLMLASHTRGWWSRAPLSFLLAGGLMVAACKLDRPEQASVPATGAISTAAQDESLTRKPRTETAAPTDSAVSTGAAAAQSPAPPPARVPAAPATAPAGHPPLLAAVRRAIDEFHPHLLAEHIAGGPVNLYLLTDARGEMVKTEVGAGEKSGSCGTILRDGLGPLEGGAEGDALVCMNLEAGEAGPNQIHVYWASIKPLPGEEDKPATGPFRLTEIINEEGRVREVLGLPG